MKGRDGGRGERQELPRQLHVVGRESGKMHLRFKK